MEALNVMVKLMRTARQEGVRLMAADRILDRAVGKAPLHIDISALRHDKIVYQSAVEIRRELETCAPSVWRWTISASVREIPH